VLSKIRTLVLLVLTLAVVGCAATTTTQVPDPTPAEPPTLLETDERGNMYYTMQINNTSLQYAVTLPDNFDANNTYPILLALPPGAQSREMVNVGLSSYWETEAKQRGWIVLSPVAPNGILFFKGSEAFIPEFLDRTAAQYHPEDGLYHIAGISNGGISAFRIALNNPERFKSIMALPGFPPTDDELNNLDALKDKPIAMFVGQNDSSSWVQRMQQTEQALNGLEAQVTFEIVPNEGHVIRSLSGEELFDLLESYR
jgi:S-formylglutathione hydrolase FrmB